MAIINTAKLSDGMKSERLDAEFFYAEDLILISKLVSEGGKALGEVCQVFNGKTPEDYFEDGDVPIVRSGDLVVPFIYPDCNREFLRARASPKLVVLQKHDVLISSIGMGSIGKISIVMDPGNFATVSEVTILRTKGYPAEILFAYLTTHAGQRQILRQVTGATGQQHLLKSKVESILVPAVPSQQIVEAVMGACGRAWSLEIEAARELVKAHQSFSAASGISS